MAILRNIHDPGLGEKYLTNKRRIVNKDGSFNVHRTGLDAWGKNLYFFLINMPWWQFLLLVFAGYVLMNSLFATAYLCIGVEHLKGAENDGLASGFQSALFFSFQTFTTVGYGGITPNGLGANMIASTEAFVGLSSFALVTGLLYGRFSKPKSSIMFSENALIAPYKEKGHSLQFRIANRRHNVLMEMEARVMLMCIDPSGKTKDRKYFVLPLEVNFIHFFPLNWTIVHPIEEDSPIYGWTAADFKRYDAEILILLKGFDDTFGQVVYQRFSYKWDEIVHNAKFKKAYDTDFEGRTIMDVNLIHGFEKLDEETIAPSKEAEEDVQVTG